MEGDCPLDCHRKANSLRQRLLEHRGVTEFFPSPTFHEFALRLPVPAAQVIDYMMQRRILAGLDMADFVGADLEHAANGLLIAVTEKRTEAELDQYVSVFGEALQAVSEGAVA